MASIKKFLIGEPLSTDEEQHQRLRKVVALPVFASDAISSTAYATDEILVVLLLQASVGALAFTKLVPIALIVVVLLAIVVTSYSANDSCIPVGRWCLHRQSRKPRQFAVTRGRIVDCWSTTSSLLP